MQYQSSIILTYKGKILLFSKDIIIETSEKNSWDFLRIGKIKEKDIVEYLRKEMSLPVKLLQSEIKLTSVPSHGKLHNPLFHFRLTDENVNGIKRKEGWRLEFYRFSELDKISLSDEARNIFNLFNNEIKELLSV